MDEQVAQFLGRLPDAGLLEGAVALLKPVEYHVADNCSGQRACHNPGIHFAETAVIYLGVDVLF